MKKSSSRPSEKGKRKPAETPSTQSSAVDAQAAVTAELVKGIGTIDATSETPETLHAPALIDSLHEALLENGHRFADMAALVEQNLSLDDCRRLIEEVEVEGMKNISLLGETELNLRSDVLLPTRNELRLNLRMRVLNAVRNKRLACSPENNERAWHLLTFAVMGRLARMKNISGQTPGEAYLLFGLGNTLENTVSVHPIPSWGGAEGRESFFYGAASDSGQNWFNLNRVRLWHGNSPVNLLYVPPLSLTRHEWCTDGDMARNAKMLEHSEGLDNMYLLHPTTHLLVSALSAVILKETRQNFGTVEQ